jgi:hypothetical protein
MEGVSLHLTKMTYQVYALIQGYTDNCIYSGEDFNTLELFFNKEDAELRQTELELKILESGREDYEYVYVNLVDIN